MAVTPEYEPGRRRGKRVPDAAQSSEDFLVIGPFKALCSPRHTVGCRIQYAYGRWRDCSRKTRAVERNSDTPTREKRHAYYSSDYKIARGRQECSFLKRHLDVSI